MSDKKNNTKDLKQHQQLSQKSCQNKKTQDTQQQNSNKNNKKDNNSQKARGDNKDDSSNKMTKESGDNSKQPSCPPSTPPWIIYRSKEGIKLVKSFGDDKKTVCNEELILEKTEDKSNRVESVCCSEDGELVAWCDNNIIKCVKINTNEVVFDKPNEFKSNCIYLSPKSTRLVSYSTMSAGDNLHFWDLSNQTHLASMNFKKASQWKPVFSMNEDICIQHIKSELILYANGKFDTPKQRISHIKVDDFSLSSAPLFESTYQHQYNKRIKIKNHHVAIYTAGSKGQPSIVKIYKYPNMNDCITNKSFFKADRVKFSWSPSGNSLLLTCQADFDQSGKSYYGEQSLNFMNVKGDSYFVKLPKEGTISHLEWYPNCDNDMFVCVYGHQPAKVSLFNNKCEVVYNFGDPGAFNTATFSPFGNLLAIYGFGNLAGQLCIWDFDKKKLLSSLKVPETTGLEWCADGEHILTCTTTPRLRVGNGIRLFHYTGSLLYEQISNDPNQNLELYDVLWQPKPSMYCKPKCDMKPSPLPNLLNQSKLSKFQGTAGKYVPPSMRNQSSTKGVFDSAIGVGAGNRQIVGLESLKSQNNNNKTNKSKGTNKTKNNNKKIEKSVNDNNNKK